MAAQSADSLPQPAVVSMMQVKHTIVGGFCAQTLSPHFVAHAAVQTQVVKLPNFAAATLPAHNLVGSPAGWAMAALHL